MSQLLISLLLVALAHGADDCPITVTPPEVVVKHGDLVSVFCFTNSPHQSIGWEASQGAVDMTEEDNMVFWSVSKLIDWEIMPICYLQTTTTTRCEQVLPVTIYKTPDIVSIRIVDHTGPMIEGKEYELLCDIQNVAPAQNLTVKWYKGQTLVDQTTFTDTNKRPVNKTAKLQITPNRADDGAQYRCEAELELGADGPQPPPTVTSEPLYITVQSLDNLCPVQLNPERVVVRYNSSVSVNCSTNVSHDGMGWEASQGSVSMNNTYKQITWSVSNLREWDVQPMCYIKYKGQCESLLPVTVYKTPDRVSIRTVDHKGPMIENNQYELLCDIQNVAPAQNLTVKWYKGQTLVDQTTFTDTNKKPVNKTAKLQITPNRTDDGAQYRCEAELELGADGPQPPPTVTSESLYITVHSLDTPCPVQFNPESVVVRYDNSVSVNCSTSVSHDGIGWEASQGSVPLTDTDLITWSVSNLREWDIKPQCFINYDDKQCESHLTVTVYKTPDSVSISTVDHTGPMIEGNQYELLCDIQNVAPAQNLTVKWYKGQNLVNQTTFTDTNKKPVNKIAKLQITANRTDDGAQYRCEAELELGADGPQPPPTVTSEPLYIIVHYKPQIKFCNSWSPVIGTSLDSYPIDSYSIVGNPRPIISWNSESSSPVNPSVPLDKSASGQYNFIASNKYGLSSCVINITVEYPPELHCNESYKVKDNELFTHISYCISGFPKPHVSLSKDGKDIKLPYYPKWNDSGSYYLTAINKHGTKNHNFTISILYGPMVFIKEKKMVALENSNITLDCKSTGNPEPEIWWSRNNVTLTTGRRQIPLNIPKVTPTSAGVYTCSATNIFGRQDKSFIVEIKETSIFDLDYIIITSVVVLLFILFICAVIYAWRKKNLSGHYQVQSHEMRPLKHGAPS